jgi:hypothetical protein
MGSQQLDLLTFPRRLYNGLNERARGMWSPTMQLFCSDV